MDKTVMGIMTAFIAVILLTNMFIPTVLPMLQKVTDLDAGYGALLSTVVTITITGVVLGVVYMYIHRED